MSINLKEKNLEQLKALAYDLLVQQNVTSNNLQLVEKEIVSKLQEEKQLADKSNINTVE